MFWSQDRHYQPRVPRMEPFLSGLRGGQRHLHTTTHPTYANTLYKHTQGLGTYYTHIGCLLFTIGERARFATIVRQRASNSLKARAPKEGRTSAHLFMSITLAMETSQFHSATLNQANVLSQPLPDFYAQPWQLGFSTPASAAMLGIVDLHHEIMFSLIVIAFTVTACLVALLRSSSKASLVGFQEPTKPSANTNTSAPSLGARSAFNASVSNLTHCLPLEMGWTILPALILLTILIPSLSLVYRLDDLITPAVTVKVIGKQWYWGAPFNNIIVRGITPPFPQPTESKSPSSLNAPAKGLKHLTSPYHAPRPEYTGLLGMRKLTGVDGKSSKGPQHGGDGKVSRIRLSEKFFLDNMTDTVLCLSLFEVHIPLWVGEHIPILRTHRAKPSGSGVGWYAESLLLAGQSEVPKPVLNDYVWNSGRPKAFTGYGLGADVVTGSSFSRRSCHLGTGPSARRHRSTTSEGKQSESRGGAPVDLGPPGPTPLVEACANTQAKRVGRDLTCKYSNLLDPNLYKAAYEKIRKSPGSMTRGSDAETLDGMSNAWISNTIRQLRNLTFTFKPARRAYIPKPNGALRPLGIPNPRDKIVQQAIRSLLEPLVEREDSPHRFSDKSHGFRPGRSAHTALRYIRSWTGITWMIEGDIKGYFDNINHKRLAHMLTSASLMDKNMIDLYWKLVNAGYVNNGHLEPHSLLGVPQGGTLSPLLSNIYLHAFDRYMEGLIAKYTTKKRRISKANPVYNKVRYEIDQLKNKSLKLGHP